MAKYCKSCGTNNSDIADTCWKCGKALNVGVNQTYAGGNQPYTGVNQPYAGGNQSYPGGNQPYSGGNQPYSGGDQPYPGENQPYFGGNQTYSNGNQPYSGANQNYYPPNGAYDNAPNKSIGATIWQKANLWKNNSLPTKYKVWSIVMFVVAFIRTIILIKANVEVSQYSDLMYLVSEESRQGMRIGIVIGDIIVALLIFINIYCGIMLLRLDVKKRGTYIFCGVFYGIAAIISVLELCFMKTDSDTLVFSILYLAFYIITTILLFSKISDANKPSGYPNGWH